MLGRKSCLTSEGFHLPNIMVLHCGLELVPSNEASLVVVVVVNLSWATRTRKKKNKITSHAVGQITLRKWPSMISIQLCKCPFSPIPPSLLTHTGWQELEPFTVQIMSAAKATGTQWERETVRLLVQGALSTLWHWWVVCQGWD